MSASAWYLALVKHRGDLRKASDAELLWLRRLWRVPVRREYLRAKERYEAECGKVVSDDSEIYRHTTRHGEWDKRYVPSYAARYDAKWTKKGYEE